jgi:peroxiredoxin Q/BCP
MPQIGRKAPDFTLPDADMEMFTLSSLAGKKNVVLFFYPKDDTPGCTTEASEFSDHDSDFSACDCVVIGINRDDCLRHAAFRDKHGLAVRLLSDVDSEVCGKYRVLQEKEVDGVRRIGIARTTFLVDKKGAIRQIWQSVTPRGHALEVLAFVRGMDQS